jgi:trans-aconitate methyltransferase
MTTRAEQAKEYDDYFTANPKKWGKTPRDEFAVNQVRQYAPQTILDVGCGNGHTLAQLRKSFPVASLYGIDISPVACDLARKASGAHVENVFLEDYHPEMKFDLVINLGTLEHLESPLEGLRKMKELTGGICYLEVPHNLLYSPGEVGFRRLTTRSQQMEWHLPRNDWEAIINASGFVIEHAITGLNEAWEFIWILR